jgi:hypothetical protein
VSGSSARRHRSFPSSESLAREAVRAGRPFIQWMDGTTDRGRAVAPAARRMARTVERRGPSSSP